LANNPDEIFGRYLDIDWESLKKHWENLCDDVIERLPKEPGAYAIRWAPRGKPQLIQRVFKEPDNSGILCFGMTGGSLKKRLKDFYLAAKGGNQQHIEGQRYCDIGYANHFPLRELQIWYRKCDGKEKAKKTELRWFKDYEHRFGELPPLNYRKG
jgi:hypothetical protein